MSSSSLRNTRRKRALNLTGAAVAAVTAAVTFLPGTAQAAPPRHESPLSLLLNGLHVTLPCGLALPGEVACTAMVDDDAQSSATAATAPNGLSPAQVRAAYSLPAAPVGGGSPLVAVVDAYDDPNLEADLAHYRAQYGLPACTSASGCLTKVSETGTGALPAGDAGWGEEESLDVDAISAVCSQCRILMVEAASTAQADLGAAVNTAARLGAVAISNSYGGPESSSSAAASSSYYNHPGIAVTASAGDSGYGAQFPASSQYVTAVGGTTLTAAAGTTRGWTEKVWGAAFGNGTGSGCSAKIAKPAWQAQGIASCPRRSIADVAAVADPASGLAIYDTYGQNGWLRVGGTSLASPIIAAVYGLAGNTGPGRATAVPASLAYTHSSSLNDVTTGTNGLCFFVSSTSCKAAVGYDGPTGLGTPKGVAAF